MSPETRDPTDPREWLRRARGSQALAGATAQPGVLLEDLGYQAQQCAEKALKAILVSRSRRFPKTHVISELLTLVSESGLDVPGDVREAEILTPYAVAARYPGTSEDVTSEELDRARAIADCVLRWAEEVIASRPASIKP